MLCPNPDCPDIELFGVQGEYSDQFTQCPKCGTALVQTRPPAPSSDQPLDDPIAENLGSPAIPIEPSLSLASDVPDDELVPIIAFDYRHEAELAVSFLAAKGIPAVVSSDDCGSVNPILGFVREVEVVVRKSDVERADDALDSFESGAETFHPADHESEDDSSSEFQKLQYALVSARKIHIVGFIVIPWVFQPMAFARAMRALKMPGIDSPEASSLRTSLTIIMVSSGFFTLFFWAFLVLYILDTYLPR